MSDREPARIDAAFQNRLRGEIGDWAREGLVSEDQAQALLARYDMVEGETAETLHRSRLVGVLGILGAVLVGIGVILLIGSNWEHIPKLGRLVLLILATAGVYHAGYVMAFGSRRYPKIGMALLLLGSLLWGASIFLVGQMYHTGGEGGEIKAVLYWIIGVLPLAYILTSPLHLSLGLILTAIWISMLMSHVMIGPQIAAVIHLTFSVLLYTLGRLHASSDRFKRLALPYNWLGLAGIFSTLYGFTFQHFWHFWGSQGLDTAIWYLFGVLFVLALASTALLFMSHRRRDKISAYESLGMLGLLVLSIGAMIYWPTMVNNTQEYHYSSSYSSDSLLTMALFNLLLLGAVVGIIALGWMRRQTGLINLGVLVFFIQVVTRYFDLLGGMLPGGLMFIGVGLLLLVGGGLLERSRRRIIESMVQRGTA